MRGFGKYSYRTVFKNKLKSRSNQCDELIRIPGNYLKLAQNARKKIARKRGAIGFGFHWLKNWPETFKPITKHSDCYDCDCSST